MSLFKLLFLFALVFMDSSNTSYKGYKVYRMHPRNREQVNAIAKLMSRKALDFWQPVNRRGIKPVVMVPPKEKNHLIKYLKNKTIEYEILVDDVLRLIRAEGLKNETRDKVRSREHFTFDEYNTYQKIMAYIKELKLQHPKYVTLEKIAYSCEYRELVVIKISTNPQAGRPVIFIDAGISARERLGPSVALYIAKTLLQDKRNSQLLNKVDWHILPLVNPDGYAYTFEHPQKRFWIKNRCKGRRCNGTNIDRNFNHKWGMADTSDNECTNNYRGKVPFSSPEARALSNYILTFSNHRIKLYLSFRSYGQSILIPWMNGGDPPSNVKQLMNLAHQVAAAIRKLSGRYYKVGSPNSKFEAASGTNLDWVKAEAGIDLTYTIELPPGGSNGYDPLADKILPHAWEMWEGLKIFHRYIERHHHKNFKAI